MNNLVGKEFESIYNKKFIVLFQIRDNEQFIYRIKFLDSNFEKKASYLSIIKGEVFDDSEIEKISLIDKRLYQSKEDGYFELLQKVNHPSIEDCYLIKFLDTQNEIFCEKSLILKGLVKDSFKPILYGIFYLDNIVLNRKENSYKKWTELAKYVFFTKDNISEKYYSYKNFKEWFDSNKINKLNFDITNKELIKLLA